MRLTHALLFAGSLAILPIVAAVVATSTGACTSAQRAAVGNSFLDCEALDAAHAFDDLGKLVSAGLRRLFDATHSVDAAKAALLADAKAIETDAGRCVLTAAVLTLPTLTSPSPAIGEGEVATSAPLDLRPTLSQLRLDLGWPPVHTKLGTI